MPAPRLREAEAWTIALLPTLTRARDLSGWEGHRAATKGCQRARRSRWGWEGHCPGCPDVDRPREWRRRMGVEAKGAGGWGRSRREEVGIERRSFQPPSRHALPASERLGVMLSRLGLRLRASGLAARSMQYDRNPCRYLHRHHDYHLFQS
eukprot:3705299-Rhodomonas_salina.1